MKKTYQTAKTDILGITPMGIMIPISDPEDPTLAPKKHFVPGPGASYDPQGNIL